MKKLVLVALLLPMLSMGQAVLLPGGMLTDKVFEPQKNVDRILRSLDAQAVPTGRTRTVKGSFQTIYTPKTYRGWIVEREMAVNITSYWEPIGYSRSKGLFFRKKYSLWEIYSPVLKK